VVGDNNLNPKGAWVSIRRGWQLALVGLLVGGGVVAATHPGHAAPLAVCGAGFAVIDSDPIRHTGTKARIGTVYLMRDVTTNRLCGATVKSVYVGLATPTRVYVAPEDAPFVVDEGPEVLLAGPVYTTKPAPGECAIWGGSMTDPAGVEHQHDRANPAIGGAVTCF
jgi:hypothetical protein